MAKYLLKDVNILARLKAEAYHMVVLVYLPKCLHKFHLKLEIYFQYPHILLVIHFSGMVPYGPVTLSTKKLITWIKEKENVFNESCFFYLSFNG